MTSILDAWAILAWVQNEQPAADRVRALLVGSGKTDLAMSVINVGEVYYRLCRLKGESYAESFVTELSRNVRFVEVSNRLIFEAARYKCRHRVSYADGFALATAIRERATLVTGDPDLETFRDGKLVALEWLR